MMTVPLSLRPANHAQRPAVAWFLPGDDPRDWLREILGWGVPTTQVTLRLIPTAANDLRPCGAFITLATQTTPQVSARARAYGVLAGRLYLPVEARLVPEVADGELAAWLPGAENIYVWHPTAGLIGFEPLDALSLGHVLQPPQQCPAAWDRAVPGVVLSPRLLSVEPEEPPTLASILREGRDEMGSGSESLDNLPQAPDETKPGTLERAKRRTRRTIASFVRRLLKPAAPQPGETAAAASSSSWQRRLQQWAATVLSQPILEERERALRRLMHLLATNPDEGLRFALPLNGVAGHRGMARPGTELTRRDVNFDLSRMQGGGTADIWDPEPETRQQLQAQYRELANRELRLGRYRRAAYIFAELLGDLPSAASALVSGRHHREAAALYRERLKQPAEAARCLENGGLWEEAARLYEDIGADEQAGDLYRRMDRPTEATRAYESAVSKAWCSGDALYGARVLHDKLGESDRALSMLAEAWPHSAQALLCLNESFRLLGELGRHDAARERIAALPKVAQPPGHSLLLVDALTTTAESYPEYDVRESAADAARIVAAPLLRQAPSEMVAGLISHLARLDVYDRLHARDCDRFRQRATEERRKPVPTRRIAYAPEPRLVTDFWLPPGVEWRAAVSGANGFYAAGYQDGKLILARGFPDGMTSPFDQISWPCASSEFPPALAADPTGPGKVLIHVLNEPPQREAAFTETDNDPRRILALTPPWAGPRTMGMVSGQGGVVWGLASEQESLVLSGYRSDGSLFVSHTVPISDWPAEPVAFPVPLQVGGEGLFLAWGTRLVALTNAETAVRELPGPIHGLASARAMTRVRLAAALPQGAAVIWDKLNGTLATCAGDLTEPAVCITGGGRLVVAAEEGCEIYSLLDSRLKLISRCEGRGQPLAVLPTLHPAQFLRCSREGTCELFEIP